MGGDGHNSIWFPVNRTDIFFWQTSLWLHPPTLDLLHNTPVGTILPFSYVPLLEQYITLAVVASFYLAFYIIRFMHLAYAIAYMLTIISFPQHPT